MAEDQQRDPFKEDFKAFLYMLWNFLNLPEPTPAQLDMADYLQHGPRRRCILAFRGVGKSWITAAYCLWLLYCDPQEKIFVVSATKQRSDDFATFCQRVLLEWELLAHLRPRDDQRQSKIAFDVAPALADHAPSVKAASITGQLSGSRASRIIADDIEIPNNSDTQVARDKLWEAVKEFDAVLKPGGEITYLGTPQCEMSLYNELPERGYEVRIWPAEIPDNHERYGKKIAPYIVDLIEHGALPGEPVDPLRFDDEDLRERKLSYGRSGYALQFMLDTSLSDADKYPLKLSDLIVMDLDRKKGPTDLVWGSGQDQVVDVPTVGLELDRYYSPVFKSAEYVDYKGIVMFIDPSGRGKDETAWAIVGQLFGRLFVLDIGGATGGYDEKMLRTLLLRAKDFGVNKILVEPNFGDGMFTQLIKSMCQSVYPCTIEDAPWARTQKEVRIIDTLEPVMNQHRLVVDKSLIQKDYESTLKLQPELQQRYRLFFQMTRISRDRGALVNDDRLDALAGAVAYWLDAMAQDSAKMERQHKAEVLDAELRKFIKSARGYVPPSKTIQSRVVKKANAGKLGRPKTGR